ncbi:LOW QUALITY PROTEIN: pleckstrin homology domain-containing family O member 1b [Symphorus nematophorus]
MRWRCGAAEEPQQRGVCGRRRRRRRSSNRTPTSTAAPGRSERSGARRQQHGAAGRGAETQRQQQLRSGGAETEAPEAPELPPTFTQFLSALSALCPGSVRRGITEFITGVTVKSTGSGSMKKNTSGKRGPQDSAPQHLQPEKVGWIRKFCGKGIFREIWKNRFVVLRGDQLFICEKEVKELGRADEVLDLSDYERCEEIRKNKSRSKKNHSKFRLQRCSMPGNTVPNLVFLAVSPEDKESWINVLNAAITRAKNRILDEVTVDDSQLSHLTRDRVKIPHNRRLPTRGHLLAVASTSSSDGMLTLDLIQEEDAPCPVSHLSPDCPRSKTDSALSARTSEASGKSQSLPREVAAVWEKTGSAQTPQPGKRLSAAEKNRCASMDEILTHTENKAAKNKTSGSCSPASAPSGTVAPVSQLQQLIGQKLEETERLLTEVRGQAAAGDAMERGKGKGKESTEGARAEAERLLKEAAAAWSQAREVLEEVKELRALCRQLDAPLSPTNSTRLSPDRRSPM